MASDKNKIANDCWRKATEALSKENWDYAIDMFSKAVELVPDNLAYRQHLRGAQSKKYKNNKTGAGTFARMKLSGLRMKVRGAKGKNDWETVSKLVEEGLQVNPWDAGLNADLGEAANNMGWEEVAIFAYQKALETEPDSKDYNRSLGELLERRGDYANAVKCFERIYKLDPLDGEARSKVGALHASKVMDRGGYETAQTTREVQTGYGFVSGPRQQKEPDGPGVSVEADLQRAIRKEPDNQNNYIKLADHYKRDGKLEEAHAQYAKALEISGGDANIREQMEDIELMQVGKNVDLAREAAHRDKEDQQAVKNYQNLKRELIQREIEIYSARVERYPSNLQLKFKLGQRFMDVKKYDKAIPLFQQASRDTRLQSDVLVNLGKCFIADKKNGLAKAQFEKALPAINPDEKPEVFKECHYLLGRLLEQAGDKPAAETHYTEVLAVDYDYRDARQRLEELQSGDGSASAGLKVE